MTVPSILAIVGAVLLLVGFFGAGVKVAGNEIPPPTTWVRVLSSLTGLGLLLLVIYVSFFRESTNAAGVKTPTMPTPAVPVKYDFETRVMGWIPQNYKDSIACVGVSQSQEHAKEGQYSLKMSMALRGGDSEKSKGEAWVDMQHNPPIDVTAPVNLKSQTITAWVYAPQGAEGEKSIPNGFQLFVKDDKWRSLYGSWKNVIEDRWFQVTLTVENKKPPGGEIDNGFDPSRIVAVGIKMGTGDHSKAQYDGPVYVDAVHW